MPLFIQTLTYILKEIKDPKCLWQYSFLLFHSNTLPARVAWKVTMLGRDKGELKQRTTMESSRVGITFS